MNMRVLVHPKDGGLKEPKVFVFGYGNAKKKNGGRGWAEEKKMLPLVVERIEQPVKWVGCRGQRLAKERGNARKMNSLFE